MTIETADDQTLGALLGLARSRFRDLQIESADLDARLIVEHFSATRLIDAVTNPALVIDARLASDIEQAIERRASGEPVHRILGKREFYGLPFKLNAATLEPRPDTEALIELVLPLVRHRVSCEGDCDILDLGTGTGAIALALLANVTHARAIGTDISAAALEAAISNAKELRLSDRFQIARSDWFESVSGQFHIIVSNPPYIRTCDLSGLQREVREHDPVAALDGGHDGLEPYRQIAAGARAYLQKGGSVCVEIGQGQSCAVIDIFADQGFSFVDGVCDLSGIQRALRFGC